jgi:hypothetical protein
MSEEPMSQDKLKIIDEKTQGFRIYATLTCMYPKKAFFYSTGEPLPTTNHFTIHSKLPLSEGKRFNHLTTFTSTI